MHIEEIKNRLSEIDVSQVCDALPSVRVISPEIKLLNDLGNFRMIGRALTVSCEGDLLPVIKALDISKSGDILVIETGGDTSAVAGELFTYEAIRKDLSGIIIDGFGRDIYTIKQLQFPFFAKGTRPNAGTKGKPGKIGDKITCGGVQVVNGEIVFADPDGIIVLSQQEVSESLPTAQQIKLKENKIISQLQSGVALAALSNFHEHYANVLKKKPSKLIFN